MNVTQFLKDEYVKTLKLLFNAESNKLICADRFDSSGEVAFKLEYEHQEGYYDTYYHEIFVIPYGNNIYLFGLIRELQTYKKETWVPVVVKGVIEELKAKHGHTIMQLPENIEKVKMSEVAKGVGEKTNFCFWMTMKIPFKDLKQPDLNHALREFERKVMLVSDTVSDNC